MAAVAAPFGRDLETDFATVGRLISEARAAGVRLLALLALPEACLGGYLSHLDGTTEGGASEGPPAFDVTGPKIRRLARMAGDLVVCAGYCEADGDLRYNAAACVSGDGVLGRHRKVHQPLREDASYAAGDRFAAFDTPVGRLGLMICYDKALPEPARTLALDGADVDVRAALDGARRAMAHVRDRRPGAYALSAGGAPVAAA